MTDEQIKAELARLDEEDAARDARYAKLKEIALDNARCALDQGDIDNYEDNVGDTIKEVFPDASHYEWNYAYDVFNKAVGRR
jgi:hypothetical protein